MLYHLDADYLSAPTILNLLRRELELSLS